ncbi:MAG: N-acetylmuramoyl-L-alanine amidase [Actinobacteria bacterium]|nr:N-acetylmuramoyl-L-alanine amidase [Actinomycetota bacterium]
MSSRLTAIIVGAALLSLLGAGLASAGEQEGGRAALVCLDPGHGGPDSGAVANGVLEKDVNLDIGLRAHEELNKLNYDVMMTRTTDVQPTLQERCDMANAARASIFVSIHNNAYTEASQGTETYCYYNSGEGRRLATYIQEQVLLKCERPDRGVKEANFFVLRNTDMPASLVEGAFLTNPAEAALLSDPFFRQNIAEGIALGIHGYFTDTARFDTYMLLANPDGEATAQVQLDYMRGDGVVQSQSLELPPFSRRTIHLDEIVLVNDVSTCVRSTNGVPVIAERAMYFSFERGRGGHAAPGVASPACEWYLAEGSTDWGFDTFVLVQNPDDNENPVTLRFMRSDGYTTDFTYTMDPHSRFTLECPDVEGFEQADFSVKVTAAYPVVVERAMYFNNHDGKAGGQDSPAVTAPATTWYLAEGYTGDGFDTFVLLMNPGGEPARVKVNYLVPGGEVVTGEYEVPAETRRTVHVDEVPGLEDSEVSFAVESDRPVVVERSMYFEYGGVTEGTNSTATDSLANDWFLAEGYTGPGFDTYILLANPTQTDQGANVRFLREDGTTSETSISIPAGCRRTITVNNLAGMENVSFATCVYGTGPIVVERAKYFLYGNNKDGGENSMAVKAPSLAWYFAEGCTR